MTIQPGKLYLLPTPLGEEALPTLPAYLIQTIHRLTYFVAERAKTARRFIRDSGTAQPLNELQFSELNKRTDPAAIREMLQPALQGHDMGLLSEAGCPGVADPGARVVRLAHELGIEVVPMVGPSSILLALMASGLNGQHFAFRGYLPPKRPELAKALRRLEQVSAREAQTQICIETPYRNQQFVEVALEQLQPGTWFCIAADLTLSSQYISTRTVAAWKRSAMPPLHKRPAIFLWQSS